MLKKFFISMLGAIAGFWLSAILFVFVLFIGIGVIVGSMATKSTSVSDKSILHLCLEGDVVERQAEFSINDLVNFNLKDGESLCNMIDAIQQAASDKKIKGIFIDCKGAYMGIASRTELVEAIKKFKESGKWVYAYADNFEQGDYYVSTIADKVYLNPVGSVSITGLSATVMFYKDLLDKLGVNVQVVKVGEFKSAVEPFIRTSMSEPSRRQTSVFLDQIWNDISGQISANRGVSVTDVNDWANDFCFTWAPSKYVGPIVNELKYRNEVENILREKLDISQDKDLPLIKPADYLESSSLATLNKGSKNHIAVLYAVGDISDDGEDGIVASKIVPQIYELAKDEKVKGLVLRVNSPGGSAFASEQIWKALEDFKATGKPFYVSMSDYAASGGYYISCGADKIYADAATLTGSIGIFGLIPDAQGLLKDKLGLTFETVETNRNANFPTLYKPMSPQQYDGMQQYVERGYETFTSRVAAGRNLPIDSVYSIGGGRVWDGVSAMSIGLVDELGSLNKVISDMAASLELKSKDYVCYPEVKDKWMSILSDNLEVKISNGYKMEVLNDGVETARKIMEISPLQTRMETIIIR